MFFYDQSRTKLKIKFLMLALNLQPAVKVTRCLFISKLYKYSNGKLEV